jgi:hypothetical protein
MAHRYTLANGESSFDGIHPASIELCGIAFGYHNLKPESRCALCKKPTHYSIHRRYKFSRNLETKQQVNRLWCCSEICFKQIIFRRMFDLVIPFDVVESIINWGNPPEKE